MKKTKKTSSTFSSDPAESAILRKVAKKTGRYYSELIREAIHEWIVKHVEKANG